jgi:LPS sulfotransferase NodH
MTSDMLVRSGFPAHWRQVDASPLRSFDWGAEGVDIPYVILVTGRCGSTHLTSMLTKSRACGEPLEYFNEVYLPNFPEAGMAKCLEEYIVYLVRERSGNRRFGLKIDHWRWEVLQSLVDVEGLLPPEKAVLFLMTRQDIVAQAHSFAVARATNIWHEYADAMPSKPQEYMPADSEILREIALIAYAETQLSRYLERSGRSAKRLTYEQLIQDPEGLLRRIAEELALAPTWRDKLAAMASSVRKLNYARREEQIESFKRRSAQELTFLDTCRGDFPYEAFRDLVLDVRGVDIHSPTLS